MNVAEQRAAVVAEALTWLGTPYHSSAAVRGAGVDCAQLPAAVYAACGLIPRFDIAPYPSDWHMHRTEERYLDQVLDYAAEISGNPRPGDFVLWRFGRTFSHGAIVVAWPTIVHAYVGRPVETEDAQRAAYLTHIGENSSDQGKPRPRRLFTLKQWGNQQ